MKSSLTVLCAFHFVGNALLLWLGYSWLGIPESNTPHLLLSLFVVLLFSGCVLWLHGTSFAFFAGVPARRLRSAAAVALRHLPALLILAAFAVFLYALLALLTEALAQPAFRLASWLTLTLRRPIPPPRVLAFFRAFTWVIAWLLLPAIFLPVAAQVSINGFGGFRSFARRLNLVRSLKICALVLAGLWLPLKLLAWIPRMPNFGLEMTSFLLRAAVSYLLFVGLLLLLERVTSAGTPFRSQRNNSAVP